MSYPIWQEFRYQRYPVQHWIQVYAATAILVTALVSLVAVVVYFVLKRRHKRRIVLAHIISVWVCLSLLAVFVGMSNPYTAGSWPIFLQDIDAKFFAEANFLTFIFLNATVMAPVSGLLLDFTLGGRRELESA